MDDCIKYHFGSDYLKADFETMTPKDNQVEAFEKLKTLDILNSNIYLHSQMNRTGKSFFLAAIYREILKKHGIGHGHVAIFSDAALEKELIEAQFYGKRDYILDQYKSRKYFIFKDFGKCSKNKELLLTPLFDFFDYLCSNLDAKRIYFASNYLPSDFARFNQDNWLDIAARINEKCEIVNF